MSFVNWRFLESQLSKRSKYERMTPLDQVDLTKMIDPKKDSAPSAELHQEQGVQIPTTHVEQEDAAVIEIEVKNMKGRVKKLNPGDYEVVITSNDQKILHERLSSLSEGLYLQMSKDYGMRTAVACLMNDFDQLVIRKNPVLSLAQAKMILLSLKKTARTLTDNAVQDVIAQTNDDDQNALIEWIRIM